MTEKTYKGNNMWPTKVNTITTVSTDAIRSRQRMAQNFLLVWIDPNIDESKQNYQITLAQLQNVIHNVQLFSERDEAIDLLTDVDDTKTFLVIEGTVSQHLVPLVHDIPQLDSIYITCTDKSSHEQWIKKWIKIKGVLMGIKPICEALQLAVKQCNKDSIAVSFITVDEGGSSTNLNQLEPSFMYTKIFKEILFGMEYDGKSIKNLADYWRKLYVGNMRQLIIIDEFESTYRPELSISWYTRESFTYDMLNQALRQLEGDTIINMGFFLCDLHKHIEQLHQQQVSNYREKTFTVYRGQHLSRSDFEKLQKSKGGLMSFNNFLSTSTDREVSLIFAENPLGRTDAVGILFKMSINPSISSIPFGSIRDVSYFKTEEEILFSMHTVFRIVEITKMENNSSLYQVDLQLTADDDEQLRTLTARIQEEVEGGTGWQRLGTLLAKLSQFDKAEELYNLLLEQTSDQGEKALYYHQLGYIKDHQGDYEKAIGYYQKALEIRQKTLPPNYPDLAQSYNNIGLVYSHMGEYSKALSFHEKSLEIRQKTFPSNHPDLAQSYNNIGLVYSHMGQYSKALSFYKKDLEICQKTLPLNHPSLAQSYNNIGEVYDNMGEYSKALSFYKKSLQIFQKTLPPNHPDLADSYNNIAGVYMTMTEYWKAFSFYEKSLEIRQKTFPPNHPDLAQSYNNIGLVYSHMGQYSKALSFYKKDLEICQKTLPPNHSNLAQSYNNIGEVYDNMGEYSKALSFYEKTREIFEKTRPPIHPLLATSYNNIAGVYYNMGEYSQALSFCKRALNIFQIALPANHPNIKLVLRNIEYVKKKL